MQRAFVLQLRHKPDLTKGKFEGRVEHVDSGSSTHVQTLDEFLDFVVSHVDRAEKAAAFTGAPETSVEGPN
jgi:hypothetical protein